MTARRREESLQDVPIAISAVSGADLAAANVVQVQDVQQKVPGLTIQASSFGSNVLQLSIRGQRQFDPYITKDPAVAVYFADVVQNRPQGLNAALYDIASVQVLKGPQGTLFGRNTTGGAMIITPEAPSPDFEGYVVGSYGNYDARRLEGAVNLPLSDWAQLRVAGVLQRRDGFTKSVTTGQRLDDEHKDSWRVSLRLVPGDGRFENRTVVSGFSADENGIGYKLYGRLPGVGFADRPDVVAELERNRALPFHSTTADLFMKTEIDTLSVSNITEYEFSGAALLRNIAGYRYVDSHIPFDLDGSALVQNYLNGPQQVAPSREDMRVRQYSDELQLLGTVLDGRLDYIFGGFYFLEKGRDRQTSGGLLGIQSAGVYQGARVTFADPIRNESYSVFAQGTFRITESLSVTVGGRQNWDDRELTLRSIVGEPSGACRLTGFSAEEQANCSATRKTSFDSFTYTLSADYEIVPDVLVYIAHRKGYRTGGFNISATSPEALAPFRPEIVKDYEVGLKTSFDMGGGYGTFNVAAYDQDYKDIQRNQGFFNESGTYVQTIVNAASAKIRGFEVEIDLHPDPLVDFGMNVSHIDAKYASWVDARTGTDLSQSQFAGTPEFTMSGYIGLNIPAGSMGELGIRGDVFHQSKTNISDNNYFAAQDRVSPTSILAAYTLVNGRVELRDIAETNITLSAWAKNLLDNQYYVGGTELANTGFGFTADFMGPPRTYGLEVRYSF